MAEKKLKIDTPLGPVSAVRSGPATIPMLVLAHGAGGDMHTGVLEGFAAGLADGGVACLRFNFAYTEAGRKGPDREPALRQVWDAVVAHARGAAKGPVWVGGKSMGGRIASMMVADGELEADGLVLVGYPLHPPGRPERIRDAHLPQIKVPMLFLQGTADSLARWDLMTNTMERLGKRATLHTVEGGDHSFRVRGQKRDDAGTGNELGRVAARFMLERVG